MGGAVFARGTTLVATILITRLLAPQLVGRLSIVQVTVTLLSGVAAMGLRIAATKRIAEVRSLDHVVAGRYVGLITMVTLASGALAALGCLLARDFVAREVFRDETLATAFGLATGVVLAAAVVEGQLGVLTGLEDFRTLAGVQLSRAVADTVGLVVGIQVAGLEGGLLGWSLGEILSAAITVVVVRRICAARSLVVSYQLRGADWHLIWRLGLPALVGQVVVQGALLGAQRSLAVVPRGYEELAAFNLAYRWSLAILFIPASVAPVVLPLLANLRSEGALDHFRRVLRANLIFAVVFTAICALAMVFLARFVLALSGSFYAAHPAPFMILALAAVPTALNSVLSQTALSVGAVRAWVLSDIALAAAILGLAAALVPAHRAVGLAIAYGGGYVVTCAVLYPSLRVRLRTMGVSSLGAVVDDR